MRTILIQFGLLLFTVSEQIRLFVLGVEQRLIIDLGKNSRESEDNYYYSKGYGNEGNGYGSERNGYGSERSGYGSGRKGINYGSRRGEYGDEQERSGNGFGLSGLRASSRTNYIQPPYSPSPASFTPSSSTLSNSARDGLPNSLSERVDRLEANQNSFRRSVMAEWQPLSSIDKRIRLFNSAKNTWREAEQICEANTGRLLHIESPDENQQIADLLRAAGPTNGDDDAAGDNGDSLYWIGMQSTLAFNIPTQNFTNFDVNKSRSFATNTSVNSSNSTSTMIEDSDDTSAEDNSAEQLEEEDDGAGNRGSAGADGKAVRNGERRRAETLRDKFHRGCAAISTARNGKWISRDCEERHQFICQL